MKIVIDAREYPTSTGRYVRKLIENLEKLKTDHEYVVLLLPKDMDQYRPNNKNFSKLAAPFPEFTFKEQLSYLRFIRNLKPDLVHFAMIQQPVLYFGNKVTTAHDLTTIRFKNPSTPLPIFLIKQLAYRFVIHVMARSNELVITPSQYVKNDLVDFTKIDPKKVIVTLESADEVTATPEPVKALQGKPFLMYVGRMMPHKNLNRLVDAYALLKKQHPDLQLVLVGKKDAMTQRVLAHAGKSGVTGVTATGYVSESELRWLYENTACYVFPSLSEGFGLPPLEAMVHGAPVASSNATCLPEVNGDAAHYFNPLGVEDMANKINDVLTDEKLRKTLIKKGYQQVKKYSWKRMTEQTLRIYNLLLESDN